MPRGKPKAGHRKAHSVSAHLRRGRNGYTFVDQHYRGIGGRGDGGINLVGVFAHAAFLLWVAYRVFSGERPEDPVIIGVGVFCLLMGVGIIAEQLLQWWRQRPAPPRPVPAASPSPRPASPVPAAPKRLRTGDIQPPSHPDFERRFGTLTPPGGAIIDAELDRQFEQRAKAVLQQLTSKVNEVVLCTPQFRFDWLVGATSGQWPGFGGPAWGAGLTHIDSIIPPAPPHCERPGPAQVILTAQWLVTAHPHQPQRSHHVSTLDVHLTESTNMLGTHTVLRFTEKGQFYDAVAVLSMTDKTYAQELLNVLRDSGWTS